MSCAPSPASSARSTGLQLGTDAGISSVLLTMIGSQCRNRNPPAMVFEYAGPWKNGKMTLRLRLTQASWWHAKGTSLQKQAYRGRTVLYMIVITRGFLFPSSWPLCLCVAFPRPPRVALREATRDNSLFHFLIWGNFCNTARWEYSNCANQWHSRHPDVPLANNYTKRKQSFNWFLTYIGDSCCQPPYPHWESSLWNNEAVAFTIVVWRSYTCNLCLMA